MLLAHIDGKYYIKSTGGRAPRTLLKELIRTVAMLADDIAEIYGLDRKKVLAEAIADIYTLQIDEH